MPGQLGEITLETLLQGHWMERYLTGRLLTVSNTSLAKSNGY